MPRFCAHPFPLAAEAGWMSAIVQVFGRRHDVAIRALMRPATEKRRGTKSREVGQRRFSERYGDLMSAPTSMAGATLARGDLAVYAQGSPGACTKELGRPSQRIKER